MTLSLTAQTPLNAQTLPAQQEPLHPPIAQDGIMDWMPSSAAGIVAYLLTKVATSDVAQVGDLMINGRDNAILAQRPPAEA
ncbi:hypothetical protein [Bordetella genomosp. 11]|uniref:Uncharacterized protein n=1 Tax=Bordetella genomosp. 11 TaxID=1416808 RepID=A0A261UJR9_9BORD|nr:hypothetical protein [Bordetella genomosp. 11]OZI61133.1 hypothetical protein CAL28_17470 [Bordetella genomosp. 11]